MRSLPLCVTISIACAATLHAQTEGHQLLFPDSTTISEEDQRAIFDQLGLSVSADGTSLEAPDCGPIFGQVEEADLNGDAVVEVFVLAGNSCTSGMYGSTVTLFIKDGEGHYGSHLGFPAGGWTMLETSNAGFSDIAIGGPGFCEGVWRWDGTTYQHDHNRETEPGGCEGIG
jgi:hypothetical protein